MNSQLLQHTETFNAGALPSGQCHESLGISDVIRYFENTGIQYIEMYTIFIHSGSSIVNCVNYISGIF